jgi:hypothetical protein
VQGRLDHLPDGARDVIVADRLGDTEDDQRLQLE